VADYIVLAQSSLAAACAKRLFSSGSRRTVTAPVVAIFHITCALKSVVPGSENRYREKRKRRERFANYSCHMYSKRTNGNKLITPPDVLEKIAAINHLAVVEVVRLFLVQALPEADWKLGTLELSRPNRVDLMIRRGCRLTRG
jgi:hypothetical protein